MWFSEAGEIVEMFRNSFPLSFLFFVPIIILISPVSPVYAAQEFSVYRMQQFDLQGSSYGNNILNPPFIGSYATASDSKSCFWGEGGGALVNFSAQQLYLCRKLIFSIDFTLP